MSLIKVKDNPHLLRDEGSRAIVNVDISGYQAYLDKRNAILKEQEEKQQQRQEIETLKNDVSEIKSLLHHIIDKINITSK